MPRFPDVELPVIVSIAPGAEPAADPDDWDALSLWTEITEDVRVEQGINITAGRGDEANQVDSSRCALTIDNRSGNYSPRNPLGQWYGALKKNTPIKIEVDRGVDTFNDRTVTGSWGTSASGNTWTAVDSGTSTFSVSPATGGVAGFSAANQRNINRMASAGGWNLDVRMLCSIPAAPIGGPWVWGVTLRRRPDVITNYMYVWARFQTTGAVDCAVGRRDGGSFYTLQTAASALTGFNGTQKVWIRARTIGTRIQAKIWYDGTSEPAAWQVSFDETNPGLAFDSIASSALLGTDVGVYMMRESGNANTGSGNLWTFKVRQTIFVGNVTEWPVRWDKSGNDSFAPITASGVIRRLQQGASPLQSPIYKTIHGQSPPPVAYWPLEDESGASSAVGVGTGVRPASIYGATFGFDGPPQLSGATSTVEITQDTTISGTLPRMTLINNAWLATLFVYTPALPPGGVYPQLMYIRGTGTIQTWQIRFASDLSGTAYVLGYDSSGNVLINVGGVGSFSAGAWHAIQLEAYQNGANVTAIVTAFNLAAGTWISGSDTTSGAATIGPPTAWAVYGDSTGFPTGSVGHVAFFNRRSVFSNSKFVRAGQGYTGELASDRVERLCEEQGVAIELLDDSTTTMGPQRADTFINLLRECETTDLGVLYETNHTPGLGYRPRPARYSSAPRLVLDFDQGHIAEPPEPTDDDQQVRNDWTVSRPNGSLAQVVDETHVAEQGRYDDSVEINVATDAVLVDHAAFRVYLGTRDDLRWPQITLNLARNETLLTYWLSVLVGTRMTISNAPDQLPGQDVDVIIEGWSQTLTSYGWTVELNCSPATPWAVLPTVVDGTTSVVATDARIDHDGTALNASVTSGATSLAVVRASGSPYWDVSGAQVPFDIEVGGERMTATAITGTGTVQTFTVTRAVNGITKAHTAGTPVRLWLPAYVAL